MVGRSPEVSLSSSSWNDRKPILWMLLWADNNMLSNYTLLNDTLLNVLLDQRIIEWLRWNHLINYPKFNYIKTLTLLYLIMCLLVSPLHYQYLLLCVDCNMIFGKHDVSHADWPNVWFHQRGYEWLCKFLPKWRNFAKSGHTVDDKAQYIITCNM